MGRRGHSTGARETDDERFIDRLYEAAAVPEQWPSVLQSFMRLAGGEHGILIAQREGFNRYVGSSPECEALVQTHFELFPANERTRRLVALRHPGFITDRDVLTEEEMANEPVYREFWFRRGYGNGVATAVFAPSGDTLILHAECLRANGPVPRSVVSRLDRLRPHFARAALLSSRLEMERVQATATALQLIGLPAAVLGRNGRMLAVNTLLAGLMPDLLQDRRSRVALTDHGADRLLDAAIAHLGRAPHQAAICSIPVRAPRWTSACDRASGPDPGCGARCLCRGIGGSGRDRGGSESGAGRRCGAGSVRPRTIRGQSSRPSSPPAISRARPPCGLASRRKQRVRR